MIRLNHVTKKFGSNEVLKGIDLTVKEGEKLVIIGPSGSGKSTLIRLMNGLEETSSGTVEINGHPMTRQTRARLNREYFRRAQQRLVFSLPSLPTDRKEGTSPCAK